VLYYNSTQVSRTLVLSSLQATTREARQEISCGYVAYITPVPCHHNVPTIPHLLIGPPLPSAETAASSASLRKEELLAADLGIFERSSIDKVWQGGGILQITRRLAFANRFVLQPKRVELCT
jgi:hypothetical protein